MLGVCLLFVGIVLINNGMCTLYHVDGKSTAIMNIFTGGLSLFINFVNLVQGNYYAAGTGLLFCFTYLFVAFKQVFKSRSHSFCMVFYLRGSQCVIFGTIEGFTGSTALGITADIRWAGIWYLWAILWGLRLWRISAGKSWENLFHIFRSLRRCNSLDPRCYDAASDLVKKKKLQVGGQKKMLCEQVLGKAS